MEVDPPIWKISNFTSINKKNYHEPIGLESLDLKKEKLKHATILMKFKLARLHELEKDYKYNTINKNNYSASLYTMHGE